MIISLKKLTEWMIYLYIIIMMISGSTGDLTVKIVRVCIMPFLMMSVLGDSSIRFVKSKYCLWAILFLLYNVVMCFFALSKSYAVEYTLTLFYVIIVNVFLCQYIYKHKYIIVSILKVFMYGALFQAFLTYGQNGLLVFMSARATEDTSANLVGFYSAIAAVFAFYFYLNSQKEKYMFIGITSIIFLVLSASRKAFLFLGIPIAFYLIIKNKNPIKVFRNILLSFLAMFISIFIVLKVPFLYELVGIRIEGLLNLVFLGGVIDRSTNTRLSLIEFGLTYFQERPWFGYGMSNFKALVEVYRSWGSLYYAHNNYVELLVDCGLVGTMLYFSIYISMLISGLRNMKYRIPIQMLAMGCLISFIICEYGMVTYNNAIYQLLIIIFFFILKDKNQTTDKI